MARQGKPVSTGGPVAVTADVFRTFTRYRMRCACGWFTTEDTLDGSWWWAPLMLHLRKCPVGAKPAA